MQNEKYYFLIMIVLGVCSCKKEIPNTAVKPAEMDVYVAGYVLDLSAGIPAYWKNGRLVLIDSANYNVTPSYGLQGAKVNSIAVSGNDVYMAGFEENVAGSGNDVAKYWKNGTPVILVDVSKYYNSEAHGIFLAPK